VSYLTVSNRNSKFDGGLGRRLKSGHLLLALVVVLYLCVSVVLTFRAVGDVRQLVALSPVSTDESRLVRMVLSNLHSGHFGSHRYYDYGGFYFMLCLALAYPAQALTSLDEPTVLVLSRLVSVLFGALSLWGLYLLGRRLFDQMTALLATIIMMVSWVFIFWSVSDHPDSAQVFFLLMALYGCIRLIETSVHRWLWFASLCAALSFSIKYVGIFMLPVIWLAYGLSTVMDWEKGGIPDLRRIRVRFFTWSAAIGLMFGAVFFLTTPYALLNFHEFVGKMKFTSSVASLGKFGVVTHGTVWLEEIGSPKVLSWVLVLFVLAYLVVFFVRYVTRFRDRSPIVDAQLVVIGWVAIFLAFLYWFIDYHPPHYLLPIVPALCLFAARGAMELFRIDSPHKGLTWIVRGAAALILVYALLVRGQEVLAFVQARMSFSLADHPIIRSGEWLEKTFPPDIRIGSDVSYNYIPKSFARLQMDKSLDTDVILLNRSAAGTFNDPELANGFVGGRDAFVRAYEFYQTLLDTQRRPADIIEIRDFGPVVVYLNVGAYFSGEADEPVHVRPYQRDNGIVLPGRQDAGDAVYAFPVQDAEDISSFEDIWGDYAVREEIRGLDGEVLAVVFRVKNSYLPDVGEPLEVLTSLQFPLRPTHLQETRFAQGVELLGYSVVKDVPGADQLVQVDLYWHNTGDITDDYTVFAHVVDGEKRTVGVGDKRPMDGRYPTQKWVKGDVIIERYNIPISPDGSTRPYYLEAGFYRWDTGERLSLLEPGGGTAVMLGPIELDPAL
jgi:4-amino-4-deoxy-L-arabinose transferase-like glycosyltransferase